MATRTEPERLLKPDGKHNVAGRLQPGGIAMIPGRYLAAMGLSLLLAMPVAAQTPSPPKSPSSPAATAPEPD